MGQQLKFSIITPSYNQGGFIERTIQSVLEQEGDFTVEYIVMDGGSTDGTLDILKKYDEKIMWYSSEDSGQSDAINQGIEKATGEIIGWLNSDDVYLPGALNKVSERFLSNPQVQWLYGNCKMIGEEDREVRKWISVYKKWRAGKFHFSNLLVENFISQPAVFFRKELFDLAGPLDPDLHYAMDFDLWLRFSKICLPSVLNDDLASFRLHEDSKSTLNYNRLFTEQYQVHERYDQGRFLLFVHRLHILKITMVYRILQIFSGK